MTKTRKIACLVAAGIIGIGVLLALGRSPKPIDRGFKNANLQGVQTEAEVVAVLGPPGSYTTGERWYIGKVSGMIPSVRPVSWSDDFAMVSVYFGEGGHKIYWSIAYATKLQPWPERLFENLRGLLN